jgi:hypothetical protein
LRGRGRDERRDEGERERERRDVRSHGTRVGERRVRRVRRGVCARAATADTTREFERSMTRTRTTDERVVARGSDEEAALFRSFLFRGREKRRLITID